MDNKNKTNVSKRLRELRQSRGMSQEDLTLESGISTRQYCDIENGVCDTKLSTLQKLACGLGVEVRELF